MWARNEQTGEIAQKHVLGTFVTHPTSLHHLSVDTDGDGREDTKLSGTNEHPFWQVEKQTWVPMGDLVPGDSLLLHNNPTPAYVLANQRQNAPPGETFTTYNFEVKDFHTYFVGEAGVWVHNAGRSPCEDVFSMFVHLASKKNLKGNALKAARFEILVEAKIALKSKNINTKVWGRSSADVTQKMLNDYEKGLITLDDLPTVKEWKTLFFKKDTTHADIDVHHAVEEYIQKILKIDPDASLNGVRIGDSCPGIALPRNLEKLEAMNKGKLDIHKLEAIHKGKDNGGISGILQSRIKKGNTDGLELQEVVNRLKLVYRDTPSAANQWPAARAWLRRMQVEGVLDASLVIPD